MTITREDKLFIFAIAAFAILGLTAWAELAKFQVHPISYFLYFLGIPVFMAWFRFSGLRDHGVKFLALVLGGILILLEPGSAGLEYLPGVSHLNQFATVFLLSVLLLCLGLSGSHRSSRNIVIAVIMYLLVAGIFLVRKESVFRELIFPFGIVAAGAWGFWSYRQGGGGRRQIAPVTLVVALLGFYLVSEVFPVSPELMADPVYVFDGMLTTFISANPIFGPLSEWVLQWQAGEVLGLVAVGTFFGIPAYNFYWAIDHPDPSVSSHGLGGVLFVLAAIGLAFFGPVHSNVYTGIIYSAGIMIFWGGLRAGEEAWLQKSFQRKTTISVGVICKNEADRIGDCLAAVAGWADEIVVLDSGSIDGTVDEARKYTDKVYETDWPGYGMQKRRVVEKCNMDWILSIDADEIITERLKKEIDGVLSVDSHYDGYKFSWRSEVFGGTVDFGADGRKHLRLFRRGGTAEFSLDVVHEGVVSVARVRALHGIVLHKTFRNYAHLLDKFSDYAMLQSTARFDSGRRASVYGAALRGIFSFLVLYFYRLGLLDGWRGLLMAALYSQYTFNKYAALWAHDIHANGSHAGTARQTTSERP